jgi:hypothetical protein
MWQEIIDFENLYVAFRKAAKGKRKNPDVANFESDLAENLLRLKAEMSSGSYRPGNYHSFWIHDPKQRKISAAPFRDRVVHHALCNIIEPFFERKFIYDSFANRTGKGTHRALDRSTQFLRKYQYVLPLDIVQFFPHMDHQILMQTISNTIHDEKVLHLCQQIIDSGIGIHPQIPQYFPGDDLFSALRPIGLPIGNLTSQFWANVYLNPLDHFIKRQLLVPGYVRYVDDLLLFGNSKQECWQWLQACTDFLAGLRQHFHTGMAQPRPTYCGIPFLGFQVFPDYRRVKRRKAVHARRTLQQKAKQYKQDEISLDQMRSSVHGWINHVRYADSWGLRKAILRDLKL